MDFEDARRSDGLFFLDLPSIRLVRVQGGKPRDITTDYDRPFGDQAIVSSVHLSEPQRYTVRSGEVTVEGWVL